MKIHQIHMFKKRNVWLFLCLMGGMMTFASFAFAHEGHGHSLQDQSMHSHIHLQHIGSIQKDSNVSEEIIQKKSEESIVHSEEQIKLSRDKTDNYGK